MENNHSKAGEKKKGMLPKSNASIFIFGVVGALVVLVLVAYLWTGSSVKKLSDSPAVLTAANIFNIPAAKINGSVVSYVDYVDDLRALNNFYQNAPEGAGTASEEQISDQVLIRLLSNALLADVAEDLGVVVTEEALIAQRAELLSQFPTEQDAAQNIMDLYGWTLEDFTEKIIRPVVLEQESRLAFEESDIDIEGGEPQEEINARHILFQAEEGEEDESVKVRAEEVLGRISGGEDFATLAAEFGVDGTKDTGGDLGYFGRGVMVPEFEEAIFSLGVDDPAQIVQTQFGYHIIDVLDKRDGKNFQQFITKSLQNTEVEILIPVHNPFEEAVL